MDSAGPYRRRIRFNSVRNIDGGILLERFLVAGVGTLLGLRFYLEATGFPQVGGDGLHVAHVLWGGLLMCAGIVVLLASLGRRAQNLAAVLGGAGFGLFIDEVGKFLTSDNNYFFKPAVAIIYIVFLLLVVVARAFERQQTLTPEAYLVNAIDLMKEAVLHDMDQARKDRALLLLQKSDPHSPFVQPLIAVLGQTVAVADPRPNWAQRVATRLRRAYHSVIQSGRLAKLLTIFFCFYALMTTVYLVDFALGAHSLSSGHVSLTVAGLGDALSSVASDLCVVVGVLLLFRSRHSPLPAYAWFRRAVLVSLFLGQFFTFYLNQLWALAYLVVDVFLFAALEYMISEERARTHGVAVAAVQPGDGTPILAGPGTPA
jgi:hypothetical protein